MGKEEKMEQIIYIVTESTKDTPLKPKIFYNYKDVRTEIFNHFNYECHLNHFNCEEQEYETVHISDALSEKECKRAIAAIGSERGWTERERRLLEETGYIRCGMGERIMRTETAATVAGAIILSGLGII